MVVLVLKISGYGDSLNLVCLWFVDPVPFAARRRLLTRRDHVPTPTLLYRPTGLCGSGPGPGVACKVKDAARTWRQGRPQTPASTFLDKMPILIQNFLK